MQAPTNWQNATASQAAPFTTHIAVLTTDGVELDEVIRAQRALELAAVKSVLVGPNRGRITAYRDRREVGELEVDRALDASNANDFDGVFVPGGVWHADALRSLPSAVAFVRAFFDAGKPIAVVGHASGLLIEADLVEERSVSGAPSLRTDLVNAGAEFVDRDVVHDDILLSGRSVPAFYAALGEHFAMHARLREERESAGPIATFWARLRGSASPNQDAR